MFQNRIDLNQLNTYIAQVRQQISSIVIGQEKMVDLLLISLLADGHVLLEGMPGVAKTLTAKLFAQAMSIKFSRIQFTPDLMPSDVLGTSIFNQKTSEFEFKPGPIFSNIVLIDEINRSPAKTQAALFEVMEERQVTIDGKTYRLRPPFIVLATQNPIEQEGTYRLPEAQLDRFLFKITVDYPSLDNEKKILFEANKNNGKLKHKEIKPILNAEILQQFRDIVAKIIIDDTLLNYIAEIVCKTRNHHALFLGASPRASLAILASAKAFAAMQGRDFVNADDIKYVVPVVLKHRIILTPEKEMEGVNNDDIIKNIVENIKIPR